ncbi:hypothetical protein [Streptomyces yaizuensis]|uniref:Uncharacterized protein n=1 Tax=Streptomyces yaizuensis TaxID=2989713 RepID=A0ABQ5P722_9ACTN|nr:hypothetical protein [Streptomyces sp. YSPA8]GLF98270.1 hypothetical protein SYYSPA8_28255 [Streptomyces sp. YSPA8]
MLLGSALAATFLVGYLAGHFELLYRVLERGSALIRWALHRDATGRKDWVWRIAVVPILAFALFVLHPIKGPKVYLGGKLAKRRSS